MQKFFRKLSHRQGDSQKNQESKKVTEKTIELYEIHDWPGKDNKSKRVLGANKLNNNEAGAFLIRTGTVENTLVVQESVFNEENKTRYITNDLYVMRSGTFYEVNQKQVGEDKNDEFPSNSKIAEKFFNYLIQDLGKDPKKFVKAKSDEAYKIVVKSKKSSTDPYIQKIKPLLCELSEGKVQAFLKAQCENNQAGVGSWYIYKSEFPGVYGVEQITKVENHEITVKHFAYQFSRHQEWQELNSLEPAQDRELNVDEQLSELFHDILFKTFGKEKLIQPTSKLVNMKAEESSKSEVLSDEEALFKPHFGKF